MSPFIYARIQSRKGLISSTTLQSYSHYPQPILILRNISQVTWNTHLTHSGGSVWSKSPVIWTRLYYRTWVARSKDENGRYTYKFPLKPTDDSTMIQEAFYLHFDHFKISENELSKKRLQPQDQPSRLQILADFEKYNDLQAISNLASVVQSKSLAETSKKIQNDFNQSGETMDQYRNLESDFHSNNDLLWSLSGRWVHTRNSIRSHLP